LSSASAGEPPVADLDAATVAWSDLMPAFKASRYLRKHSQPLVGKVQGIREKFTVAPQQCEECVAAFGLDACCRCREQILPLRLHCQP
jgi:hypothetical protein